MKIVEDLNTRRQWGDCFYLDIPLDASLKEIQARISHATSVEKAVRSMLDGTTNLEEMLEQIEPILLDLDNNVDAYIEDVEENMEYTLPFIQQSYLYAF